jgi:hypothetical protein
MKQLYGNAMLGLCQTYNEAICSYGRMGLGQIACELINGNTDSELSTGLKILRELTYIARD